MALTRKEIDGLLRLVGLTREQELDCDECLVHLAEFAEQELSGKPIAAVLAAVEHHLAICAECREEYEALQRALDSLDR